MLFTGAYMLNLLCAIVPCQLNMRPTEAHIADVISSDFKSVGDIQLDPLEQNKFDEIKLQRIKRLNEDTTVAPNVTSTPAPVPSTESRFPNLMNPLRTLMSAFQRGLDQSGGFMLNFGNKFEPFPEDSKTRQGRGSFGNTNKRNAPGRQANGSLKETMVYLRNGDAVEGYYMGTMKGRRIMAFQGIPYAEPPVGNLRFRSSLPKQPWHGLLKATRTGSECLQGHPTTLFRISGSEDCLFLNVYTPKTSSSASTGGPFPVIFFIHGGSFMYGSGSEYGPAYLLDEDVVLITVNYRLGALGFMTTGDVESPGNYGLKDQALALRWVYDNIEQFGGDKSRITVMGQSAGGISAHLHLLANKTTNLFQNGISLSGSAFGFWPVVPKERALGFTSRLAKSLRCPQGDSRKMMECLRSLMPNYIVGAQLHFFTWIPFHPLIVFAPVVEPEGPESYLTKSPKELYDSGKVERKPWIFGQTSQEGHFETYLINLFMQTPILTPRVKDLLPVVLDYKDFTYEPERSELTEAILNFYGVKKTRDDRKIMNIISDMYTDRIFMNGIQKSIRNQALIAPTYAYLFDYMGNSNLGQIFGASKPDWGVVHTEDLFFIFNSSIFYHGFRRKDPEYKLSQVMTNVIGNFAKYGEPLYTNDVGNNITIWDTAILSNVKNDTNNENNTNGSISLPIRYLHFDKVIDMIDDPYVERHQFWKSLKLPM